MMYSRQLKGMTRLIQEMKIVERDDVQREVTWGRDLARKRRGLLAFTHSPTHATEQSYVHSLEHSPTQVVQRMAAVAGHRAG